MTSAPFPDEVSAVLSHAEGATWTRLRGLTGGAWLLRRMNAPALVARTASDREVLAATAADAAGVGPPVVAAAAGWLVVEFLPGSHVSTLELHRPTVIEGLASLLFRWHASDVQLPASPLAPLRQAYLDAVSSRDQPEGLAELVAEADDVERELEQVPARLVPAHLDVCANLLAAPSGLRLIDFEYAAAAPAARELGQVAWEAELGRAEVTRLMRAYGTGDDVDHAETVGWVWVSGVTWTLWGFARAGDPVVQQYARRSWERLQKHWSRPGV